MSTLSLHAIQTGGSTHGGRPHPDYSMEVELEKKPFVTSVYARSWPAQNYFREEDKLIKINAQNLDQIVETRFKIRNTRSGLAKGYVGVQQGMSSGTRVKTCKQRKKRNERWYIRSYIFVHEKGFPGILYSYKPRAFRLRSTMRSLDLIKRVMRSPKDSPHRIWKYEAPPF